MIMSFQSKIMIINKFSNCLVYNLSDPKNLDNKKDCCNMILKLEPCGFTIEVRIQTMKTMKWETM